MLCPWRSDDRGCKKSLDYAVGRPDRIERMCGIVGYVGHRSSIDVVLGGLRRLEYRGYDSAGVAVMCGDGVLRTSKKAGKLGVLEAELAAHPLSVGGTGIGHTRWATHGGPTDANAHPHLGDQGRLALIHNGIIENFAELRAALRRCVARFEGAYTFLAVHEAEPGRVVGARRNSPLVVGLGDGENFLGSDVAAFVGYTQRAIALGQDQIVDITATSVTVSDFDGREVVAEPFRVAWEAGAADKGGWSSFMRKEVSEQPVALANALLGRVNDGDVAIPELTALGDDLLRGIHRIVIIACGTAAYAGMV